MKNAYRILRFLSCSSLTCSVVIAIYSFPGLSFPSRAADAVSTDSSRSTYSVRIAFYDNHYRQCSVDWNGSQKAAVGIIAGSPANFEIPSWEKPPLPALNAT